MGILLIDELWVLADLKVHHFEADTGVDHRSYTNVTLGVEIGWRYFLWKGLNVGVVARYWPQIHSSAGGGVTMYEASGKTLVDEPQQQGYGGFFCNMLLGWAFDV